MRRALIWLIPLLLLVPACDLFDDDDDTLFGPLAFATVDVPELWKQTASTELFRDPATWESFYCLHTILDGPCEPRSFDFERSMLVGIFWGHGFSGCTDNTESVTGIERTRFGIEVTVVTPTDLGDCEALVAPWQLVQLDRSAAPVVVLGLQPAP